MKRVKRNDRTTLYPPVERERGGYRAREKEIRLANLFLARDQAIEILYTPEARDDASASLGRISMAGGSG